MLIALAVGLWPQSVSPSGSPSGDPYRPAAVPVVQTLAVGQVAFWLLAYPVIVLFRASRQAWRWWPDAAVETIFWTLLGAVFFVPAVWLSDSVPGDAVRAAVYIATLWPLAWVGGAWLSSGRTGRSCVVFIFVFAALGLPGLWYTFAEFFPSLGCSEMLWRLCPGMQAWSVSSARGSAGGLAPLWAFIVWPAASTAIFVLWTIQKTQKRGQEPFLGLPRGRKVDSSPN